MEWKEEVVKGGSGSIGKDVCNVNLWCSKEPIAVNGKTGENKVNVYSFINVVFNVLCCKVM